MVYTRALPLPFIIPVAGLVEVVGNFLHECLRVGIIVRSVQRLIQMIDSVIGVWLLSGGVHAETVKSHCLNNFEIAFIDKEIMFPEWKCIIVRTYRVEFEKIYHVRIFADSQI